MTRRIADDIEFGRQEPSFFVVEQLKEGHLFEELGFGAFAGLIHSDALYVGTRRTGERPALLKALLGVASAVKRSENQAQSKVLMAMRGRMFRLGKRAASIGSNE